MSNVSYDLYDDASVWGCKSRNTACMEHDKIHVWTGVVLDLPAAVCTGRPFGGLQSHMAVDRDHRPADGQRLQAGIVKRNYWRRQVMEFIFIVLIGLIIAVFAASRNSQRYHEAGEGIDSRNIEDYGHPVRSLFTSTEVFTLHHRIEITDESGQSVYRAETQFPSIHDKTDIYRSDGSHVAHMERKLFSLHEIRYVEMENGRAFELSNELFHLIRDVTNIEGLGWILEGNFLQLNFSLKDQNGKLIAVVGQKMFSVHDKYCVDIYEPEQEETVVAILIALQHMIRDRQAAASGSASAGSNA